MTYKLVIFQSSWADEFDIFGFKIVKSEYWNLFEEAMNSIPNYIFEWYFGTNQVFEEDSQEIMKSFKTVDISEGDVNQIERFFGKSRMEYGIIPNGQDLLRDFYEDEWQDEVEEVELYFNYLKENDLWWD